MIKELIERLRNTNPEIIFDMNTKELMIGDHKLDYSSLSQAKTIARMLGVKTIMTKRVMKNYVNVDGSPRGYKGRVTRGINE